MDVHKLLKVESASKLTEICLDICTINMTLCKILQYGTCICGGWGVGRGLSGGRDQTGIP